MKFQKITGTGVFLLLLVQSFAQFTISGNITDAQSGETLPGASVYISDLKTGSGTDLEGYYEIRKLRAGTYLLEVSFVGYNSQTERVRIAGDTVLNFSLEPAVTELNEIVVTGMTRSTERRRSPVIIKGIDRDFLQQSTATNLIDGLKTIPGVNQITTGPSISKPVIRGLGFNRILTLNNGIRQEGQQWGDEHGIEIDEFSVDRVEVVKGPGSLVYGSDGIAGVLNFLSPRPQQDGKMKTQLTSNFQSNNRLLGHSLSNSGNRNGFIWSVRGSHKMAGDYENMYDGKVYNSGSKEYNGKLMLGINRDWGYSHLNFSTFNTKLGIVEGERDEQGRFTYEDSRGEEVTASGEDYKGYRIGWPNQKINHLGITSNNYFLMKKGTLKADLGMQNNRRREYEEIESPEDPDLYLSLNTFTYNVRYDFEEIKDWETTVGVSGMSQGNQNKGEEYLIPDYRLTDVGVFVFTQKTMERWTLAGGLRLDNRWMNADELYLDDEEEPAAPSDPDATMKFGAIRKSFNGFSGSVGLSYQAGPYSTFKFNLSRGFRAPNIAELASNGVHEGTFRYEVGNPNLKSEHSNQIDFGYHLNKEHLSLEITPFINFIDHYVFIQRFTGDQVPDPESQVPVYEYTSGNAMLYGGEVYLDIHPHPLDWLHLAQTFSMVNGLQRNQPDSTRYLPSIPSPKYRGEIKMDVKSSGNTLSNSFVKLAVDHHFRQDRIFDAYDTETATPAYTLLSIAIGTNIRIFDRKDFLSLHFIGENLADTAYQDHLSRLKYAPVNPVTGRQGVFNTGRNFSLKLMFNF